MKEQLKILTCGSVDDGKSTLIGHLLYDSKLLFADQKKALELDSKISNNGIVDYSLLLDGLDEEREQKITIDVAYRYFNTSKRSFIVLDSPGHEEYTRNMAVAASQADLAILLVDATKGVLKQTKRHLKICMMMGIKDYIVVINKMDIVDYNKNVFDVLSDDVRKLFNFYNFSSLKIIPISATVGDNITDLSSNMKWYDSDTLMQYLEMVNVEKQTDSAFIMLVQRVCRPNQNFRGFQGNVDSGNISVGDSIICFPSKEKANVKQLFNLDKPTNVITKGEAVTIVLDKDIDVSRGCVLSSDEKIDVSNNINVTMLWMDEEKLKINNAYYINVGSLSTLCYIRKVNYKINIDTNECVFIIDNINKNDIINCDLEILEKIPVTLFKYNKNLGSLILINRLTNATSSCAIINKVLNNDNLFYHKATITSEDRKKLLFQEPITIWFTGLSCSGKSTIANELDKMLNQKGYHTMLLDGDNIRMGLNKNLKFSDNDRIENIRRVAEVAKLMNDAGLISIVSFISPLEINRVMAKNIIGDKFFLVYVNTPLDECERRDKKGLYKKARAGEIKNFTGISSQFDIPHNADIIVNNVNYKDCANKIYKMIEEKIKF